MAAPGFNLGDKLLFQGTSANSAYPSTSVLFNNIVPNVYLIAGIVVFFMIVVGGFMVITNAGNADKAKEGGRIVTSAIIGLVVLFASYWIIQLIQVLTGLQILNSSL